jgi:DNA-binding NarL/FixJ family response regulator
MHTTSATILVIEKHPLMRAAIVNAIADELDLTIAAIAADGGDTLKIIESLQPEIILFAIGNPGEEDLEAMQDLREHSPKAAILALTTHEVPGQDQSALAHGADAVLAKTAPRAELLHALRTMKANMKGSEENMPHVHRRGTG